MAYIQNTYLAPSQRLVQALPTIYGVGAFSSRKICAQLGWSRRKLVKELAQTHRDKILRLLQRSGPTGVSLKRTIAKHVQESQFIGSYKGFRHQERLPV